MDTLKRGATHLPLYPHLALRVRFPVLIPKTPATCVFPRETQFCLLRDGPSTARRHSIYLKHERSSDLRFIVTLLRIVRVGLFFQTNFGAGKLAVLGLSLCLVTGCGGNARDIVGAWRTSTDPNAMVWEFSSDGSVLMGTNRGRYSFGDNNRIKIETSIATSVYQMELVGDKMTLKEPNGSKLVLTRVK